LPKSKDGMLALPTNPGMGLTVDRKKLEKYRVS
jgi:L-alanine-DL-glutamate epimerase-like enolase superfamily enzyme